MDLGTFCEGETSTVTITYGNKKEVFKVPQTPVTVEHTEIADAGENCDDGKKCYRFYGENTENGATYLTFEHYVRAYDASYQPDPSLGNNGAWLIADGELQNGSGYYYFQGTFGSVTYSRHLEVLSKVGTRQGGSTGNCDCPACQIKVTNKDNQILYNKTVASPCDVKVDCGDCPAGTIKCEHPRYPGYCCLPCKSTAEKINNLANKIR